MGQCCSGFPFLVYFAVNVSIIVCQWFTPSEFGTWYSIINTTMNVACSVGPILAAYLAVATSWRVGMAAAGKRTGLR